jgi:hypothetical protein
VAIPRAKIVDIRRAKIVDIRREKIVDIRQPKRVQKYRSGPRPRAAVPEREKTAL